MNKIKLLTIFALTTIGFCSCNSKKISGLEHSLSELNKENSKLKDSIQQLKKNTILAFHLLGNLEQKSLKVNERGIIKFSFGYEGYIGDLSKYDVYKFTGANFEDRELILKNQEMSEFDFPFTPTSLDDNRIKLLAVFHFGGREYLFPADLTINITE